MSDRIAGDYIETPFPLANGGMAYLVLPRTGLEWIDADRLRSMIDSLVISDEGYLSTKEER